MGDPVTMAVASTAMSVGGKGMSIMGKLDEGRAAKLAGQLKAGQLKMAAEAGRVRAEQADATYREELASTMSNIAAIRAAQGMGDSPTSAAIYAKAEALNDRARKTAVGNENLKALGLEGDSAAAFKSSQQQMTSAWLKAAPDMMSLAQSGISGAQSIKAAWDKKDG